jgi:hypothetical protein
MNIFFCTVPVPTVVCANGGSMLDCALQIRSAQSYCRNVFLSYIYLGSSVCHIPVLFLSYSCRPVCSSCGTLSYSFSFSNQTDQGNETEGLEREGLEMLR